MLANPIAFS